MSEPTVGHHPELQAMVSKLRSNVYAPKTTQTYNVKFRHWEVFAELFELQTIWQFDIQLMELFIAYLSHYTSIKSCYFDQYLAVVESLMQVSGVFTMSPAYKTLRKKYLKAAARILPNDRELRDALLPSALVCQIKFVEFSTWSLTFSVQVLLLVVGQFLGWRASSLFHLQVGDLRIDHQTIVVAQGYSKTRDFS